MKKSHNDEYEDVQASDNIAPVKSEDDDVDIEPGGSAPSEPETPSKLKHINFFEEIEKMVSQSL
jgi:hypothetical protein